MLKNHLAVKIKKLGENIIICINILLLALVTNVFAEQQIANSISAPAPTATQQLLPSPLALQPQQSYAIELQVNTQTEDERKQTFTKALDQVLTKNSGNPKITTLAPIKTALSNPSLYIQRYTYVTHNLAGTAVGQPTLFLQVQFNQAAITQLLHLATQPEQKTDKQQILVWLVKVVASGNKIMEDERSNDGIAAILKKSAQHFDISTIFPISDLEDTNHIKANDVCNLNMAIIKDASARYKTPTIVAGCITEPGANNMWTSQWLLLRENTSNNFSFSGAKAEDVIMQVMSVIASKATGIAKQPSNQTKKLTLRVVNVNGLNQYNEVVQYLNTFNQTTQIDLLKIGPTEVELGMNTKGDKQAFIAMLNAQNKLVRNTDTPMGVDLDYKWVTVSNEQLQAISAKSLP